MITPSPRILCRVGALIALAATVVAPALGAPDPNPQPDPEPTPVSAESLSAALEEAPIADESSPAKAFHFPAVNKDQDGRARIGFEHLASYHYGMEELQAATMEYVDQGAPVAEHTAKRMPAPVRELDDLQVRMSGYLMPIKMENGYVTEMFLVRSPTACCYGSMPLPNEWVLVRVKTETEIPIQHIPYHVYGTLRVGEFFADDMFMGLYQVDATRVSVD